MAPFDKNQMKTEPGIMAIPVFLRPKRLFTQATTDRIST